MAVLGLSLSAAPSAASQLRLLEAKWWRIWDLYWPPVNSDMASGGGVRLPFMLRDCTSSISTMYSWSWTSGMHSTQCGETRCWRLCRTWLQSFSHLFTRHTLHHPPFFGVTRSCNLPRGCSKEIPWDLSFSVCPSTGSALSSSQNCVYAT